MQQLISFYGTGLMFNVSVESQVSGQELLSADGFTQLVDVSFGGHFPADPCRVRLYNVIAQNIHLGAVQLFLWNQSFNGAIIDGLITQTSQYPNVILAGRHCRITNWIEWASASVPTAPSLVIASLESDMTPPNDPELVDLTGYGQFNYIEFAKMVQPTWFNGPTPDNPRVVFQEGASNNTLVVNMDVQRGDGIVIEEGAHRNRIRGTMRAHPFDTGASTAWDDVFDLIRVEDGAEDNDIRDMMFRALTSDSVQSKMRSAINIEAGAERTVVLGNHFTEDNAGGTDPTYSTDVLIDNGSGTILDYPTGGSYGSNIIK